MNFPFNPFKPQPQKPAAVDPSKDPNMIRVFDVYGREMYIKKEEWRTNVLPGTIKSNWNDSEKLYGVIVSALDDNFFADVLPASKHLHEMDANVIRGTCIYGIALTKNNRLDEAEQVFQAHIKKHGQDGYVLTNLAKVYAARNNHQKAEEILWRGLEIDPNQDNAVGWYLAIHRERGGQVAGSEALQKIRKFPGSWRAQLWLAREALQSKNLGGALELYRECLERVTKPVPADFLMQMSGDLGNSGHVPEILQLVEPYFDVKVHGLKVGNNLIKAHLGLRQFDASRRILNELYSLNRQDWKKNLSFWDTEIAKAELAASTKDSQEPMEVTLLGEEGPIWLNASSPAAELFPSNPKDASIISFLGCSAEVVKTVQKRQLADPSGRMSRALPFFLAEYVEFNGMARVQTLVPWITKPFGSFVLQGVAWKDEDAANNSRQGQLKSDYVVTTHLKTVNEPWVVELRLIRSIDAKCLASISAAFPMAHPEQAIPQLAEQLMSLLVEHIKLEIKVPPSIYQVPRGINFGYYLLRLEQLLAVRCIGGFLSGERDIIDGNIQLCLACPDNVVTRLLLVQTLQAMKKVKPDILLEFKDKIVLLQKEKPLSEPPQSVVQSLLKGVFG